MTEQEQADLEETNRVIAYLEAGMTEADLGWVDRAQEELLSEIAKGRLTWEEAWDWALRRELPR